MRVLIIGGVAGGASAAARIRRLDENAEIVIYEKSGFISYANCGLPYYIGDEIKEKKELTLQTPQSFYSRFRIEAKVNHEVLSINRKAKTITVKDLESVHVFEDKYDKLILSPGAKPNVLRATGLEGEGFFTLRNVEDTLRIRSYVEDKKVKSATVIGGGFIGLEVAENLRLLGLDVTIIEYASHLLAPLDLDMASFLHAEFRAHGVKLMLSEGVTSFARSGKMIVTKTNKNNSVLANIVIIAAGVTPDSTLAKDAGLELRVRGSIKVDEHMMTSDKDIYAVGDAVSVKHFVTGEESFISLAGPANKEGRIAADNICGLYSVYKGSQGSSVLKAFDLTVATTGINELQAQKAGINYEKVILSPLSHAGYYPGGKLMTLKVLYDKGGLRVLGAQIIGQSGVDKRVDVIATAIHFNAKITDLKDLDLAYAPPYSSAKDPVNMAGFMGENIENRLVEQVYVEDLYKLKMQDDSFFLDVRTDAEFERGHVDGFYHIPVDNLRERCKELPKDKKLYLLCQSGLRSYIGVRMLKQLGYDAFNIAGGYRLLNSFYKEVVQNANCFECGLER